MGLDSFGHKLVFAVIDQPMWCSGLFMGLASGIQPIALKPSTLASMACAPGGSSYQPPSRKSAPSSGL